MPKLTADQARQLAQAFHDASVQLGNYRFANWANLKPTDRTNLENAQWSLLNASSDMVITATKIVLDDTEKDFAQLKQVTATAERAIAALKTVGDVLNVAASLVTLAAAIVSMNPGSIVSAVDGVIKVIQSTQQPAKADAAKG